MFILPNDLSKKEKYKFLIGSILPRPIAFVTSQNEQGVMNGAPFSFFNIVATDPPMVSISCIRKPNAQLKDTAANIIKSKEFVIHIVDENNVKKVNHCSTDYPSDISEITESGLTIESSHVIKVPGIKESKIRMECILHEWVPLGGTKEEPNADLIIGEIVCFHVDPDLYFDGKINIEKLKPVSRLAGTVYGMVGEMFSMPRGVYERKDD